MKICVLQPDYSQSQVDYKKYDPPRNLDKLYPEAKIDHVFLNKLTTYKQLKELSEKNYDIFVNLCEAYLEWDVPSIDVIHSLELLNLPYTGPTPNLYDPPKELMKYVAFITGVEVPNYRIINHINEIHDAIEHLSFPMFVKPSKAGDSLGIDKESKVTNIKALRTKTRQVIEQFGEALVEEYIDGREFTVLVAADPKDEKKCISFKPIEYIFPETYAFKTYELKTSELHPECNVPCKDKKLEQRLRSAAEAIFKEFGGKGYARMDFRLDSKGILYFLEVNFTCSVFYTDGYEGSADHILSYDGIGQSGFLKHIIKEGIARHKRKQSKYYLKKNGATGYGIYAKNIIKKGELIYKGEEQSQRIVTKSHVLKNWSADEIKTFRRYAYPISDEVFILWDTDPQSWAPQNHSCDPNTEYKGLDVIAIKDIFPNEELTLDYSSFLNEEMQPFKCNCKSPNCRQWITGMANNSISARERNAPIIVEEM